MPAATIPSQRYPDDNSVTLSAEDFAMVAELVRNPPKPNPALRRAFEMLRANDAATKSGRQFKSK